MPGGGKDLGDAGAHHAAADDGDALCAVSVHEALRGGGAQAAVLPPSTIRMSPVTKSDAAEAR